ncbi:MAG: hypothetical protein KAJ48_04770 [Elusimicrobiales bacterium]|nr:hypothetical protein [Elusimicrobiales bacterium]
MKQKCLICGIIYGEIDNGRDDISHGYCGSDDCFRESIKREHPEFTPSEIEKELIDLKKYLEGDL